MKCKILKIMIDINKEAEEYAKNKPMEGFDTQMRRDTFNRYSLKDSFIAGYNSKATQAKVIQGQIDSYQECLYYIDENHNEKFIINKINKLTEQLKELENESSNN
jgi:hypothetical protein